MPAKLKRTDLLFPELSYKLIGCAYNVYNELGAGHQEKYYQRAFAEALKIEKLKYQDQATLR